MIKLLSSVFFILLFFTKSYSQVINIDNKKFNCDTAYKTMDLGLCSQYIMEQSIVRYDSLVKTFNKCLDKLIIEDLQYKKELLKENVNQTFDFWTDYSKIKEMFNKSDKTFKEFAELETNIIGEFYGLGRERNIGENLKKKDLYDKRILEITEIIKRYCN
jgi:hypothetical protein